MKIYLYKGYLLSICFVCIIIFPLLNDEFGFIKDIKGSENRKLNPKPELNINLLDPFPNEFEKYYNDTFCLRNRFILYYDEFSFRFLKKSPYPDYVVIGKEGWLFFAGDEMESYTGLSHLNEQELISYVKELEFRQKYLEERGCKFYFMIIPSKPSIYSEYLPLEVVRVTEQTTGEKLINYINEKSNIKTINLFKAFKENRSQYTTYYKLDNHWNSFGAFSAAVEVIKEVKNDFPKLDLLLSDSITVVSTPTLNGNIISMIGKLNLFIDTKYEVKMKSPKRSVEVMKAGYGRKVFPYPSLYESVFECKDSTKPKLLVISDSFGLLIFPFLTEKFRRSVKVWDNCEYKLNEDIVEKEKPEVFLLMIHEKNLRHLLRFQSRLNK